VSLNERNHDFDDERLDCGHYEYLSRAVSTSRGFLICASCHAASLNPLTRPRAWHAGPGMIGTSFLTFVSALWRAQTTRKQNV
jgi:hypothetical protein